MQRYMSDRSPQQAEPGMSLVDVFPEVNRRKSFVFYEHLLHLKVKMLSFVKRFLFLMSECPLVTLSLV